jgi:hypothetical protein
MKKELTLEDKWKLLVSNEIYKNFHKLEIDLGDILFLIETSNMDFHDSDTMSKQIEYMDNIAIEIQTILLEEQSYILQRIHAIIAPMLVNV